LPWLCDPDDFTTVLQETLLAAHASAILDTRKFGNSRDVSEWTLDDLKQVSNKLPTSAPFGPTSSASQQGPARLRAQLITFRGVVFQETIGERKKLRPIAIPDAGAAGVRRPLRPTHGGDR
jgi:hypothetical protein